MEKLKDIVARVFEISKDEVTDELTYDTIEKWDSFAHMLLITEIEKDMGIEFTIFEIEQARTFKVLREIVSRKL